MPDTPSWNDRVQPFLRGRRLYAGGYLSGSWDLSEEEVRVFEADPIAFTARRMGIEEDLYRQWTSAEEAPLVTCSGRTKKGDRCRAIVRGGLAETLETFVALQGQTCRLHGDA